MTTRELRRAQKKLIVTTVINLAPFINPAFGIYIFDSFIMYFYKIIIDYKSHEWFRRSIHRSGTWLLIIPLGLFYRITAPACDNLINPRLQCGPSIETKSGPYTEWNSSMEWCFCSSCTCDVVGQAGMWQSLPLLKEIWVLGGWLLSSTVVT